MHYADHVAKEWDNKIQLIHYLVIWKNTFQDTQIRWKEKKTQTKLQRQMKTIRGTVVTEMKKKIPHDNPCQLKKPHGLE